MNSRFLCFLCYFNLQQIEFPHFVGFDLWYVESCAVWAYGDSMGAYKELKYKKEIIII
jgi:hypothetical protein